MAAAWVRSLGCRSSHAVTDVAVAPSPAKKPPSPMLPVSCAVAAAGDVMDAAASAQQARKKKLGKERERRRGAQERQESRPRPKKKPKSVAAKSLFMASPAPAPAGAAFLTMAELPEGHSSRQVVELIFSSGWSDAAGVPAVEALFRVHCAARAVARFEEARAAARAHGAAARCGADGNEMMRFQCRASAGAGVATCSLGSSVSAVRTFACSGAAHASAGGVGSTASGRRAMLVCRVIAGRVRLANDPTARHARASDIDYDSVDMDNGELVVLDSRAVLPCFLIIYKV